MLIFKGDKMFAANIDQLRQCLVWHAILHFLPAQGENCAIAVRKEALVAHGNDIPGLAVIVPGINSHYYIRMSVAFNHPAKN